MPAGDDGKPHPWRLIYGGSITDRSYDEMDSDEEDMIREEFDRLLIHQSVHRNIVHPEHPDHTKYPLCGRTEPFDDITFKAKEWVVFPPGWFSTDGGDRMCTYCLEVWRAEVW